MGRANSTLPPYYNNLLRNGYGYLDTRKRTAKHFGHRNSIELIPSLSLEDTPVPQAGQNAHGPVPSQQSASSLRSSKKGGPLALKMETSLEEASGLDFDTPELNIELDDDSPYPEVRATVSNTDDPMMPTNTFRMWFLGILSTAILSIVNQFFSMRYPRIGISVIFVQLLTLPIGKFLAYALPKKQFRIFGYVCSFNPGPFNIKEHALICVMASFGGAAYATEIVATQRVFYNRNWGTLYEICLVISTRFLVWPASMVWPGILVTVSLFTTLHEPSSKTTDRRMSRHKFFYIAMACSAVYYWFPGYIFQALSMFNWVCWIAPDNSVVNSLFGYTSGLGMSLLTFDWNMINYVVGPLYTPWWAQVNTYVAGLLLYWIVTPICYYLNVFYSAYLPISSVYAFDNTGSTYIPEAITVNGVFNETMYEAYSPRYMSVTFALDYGLSFALITAVIVHTLLWHRHDIVRQFRTSLSEEDDIHARLMKVYPEVPDYFALALVTILVWPTELPAWALIIAVIISLVYLVPTGIIVAISNFDIGTNVISELISGYLLPGRPAATMIFKTFGLMTTQQALGFVSDLKFGHYMKIPPRMMFSTQIIATLLSGILVVLVQDWMFANVPGLCTPDQVDNFICPGIEIFGAASLIFGTIGPKRFFATGLYTPLLWCFLIGAILPVIFWFLAKRYPNSGFKWVNIPLALGGLGAIPPASGYNYFSAFLVGGLFMYYLRRYHFPWWAKYNYVLSVALDSGVAITALLIYLCLYLPGGVVELVWWGNTVFMQNLDGVFGAWKQLPLGGTFGLTSW
ncbi:OPT oligopeptide transporter [Dacryopinax primogenitus]|uniref:OPT oligopeptide transporter n=1 Tax=Dacryopinax primogenitus (strain DJM 731) TaxID=1858805 RepID=M5FNW1_DACPD|nr:OPT oligopeptide transporter [Dacryopinax primogenitus]EJT97990.1 OPT oligopeptide transporter [Dacryopinax primogenitus]